MADLERTGLLIERGLVHGVKLAAGRDGAAVALSWPVAPVAADAERPPGEVPDGGADSPPLPALSEPLRAAGAALKIEAGCALALPTDALVIKVLTLPPADAESLGSIVRLQMEKFAPCAGEELAVGFEVLAQEESGVRVFAAALPQAGLDRLAQELAGAGLRLTRIDAALLGWWRQLADLHLPEIEQGVCAVCFEQGGAWDFILAARGEIVLARGFGLLREAGDLGRELTLSLLNHEMETGPVRLETMLVVSATEPDAAWMRALAEAAGGRPAPRWLARDRLGAAALGVARREGETGRLDLIPAVWRMQEQNQQSRRRFLFGVGAAVALWLVLAAALVFAPVVVRQRTAAIDARIAAGEADHRAVSDVRQRVRLIRSYMERSQSLLEVMREICTVMPDGLEFGSVTYRRDDALRLMGDADQSAGIYALKDALDASGRYESTRLQGVTLDGARRRYRFEIDARFKGGAE